MAEVGSTPTGSIMTKPGIKTSEFWTTIMFHGAGVALAILGAVDAEWAIAASAAVQSLYSWSRGQVKSRSL